MSGLSASIPTQQQQQQRKQSDTNMVDPCDICGDIGVLEAICVCSKCNINCEHAYCRRIGTKNIANVWFCDACEMENMTSQKSVKEDLNKPLASNSLLGSGKGTLPAQNSKPRRQEKVVRTGKVKCIPADEAIMLSSGSNKCGSPKRKTTLSNSRPSKIVGSMYTRTLIKQKAIFSLTASGPLPDNKQSNSQLQQKVGQTSQVSKESKAVLDPRKENVHMVKPISVIMPAVETKGAIVVKDMSMAKEASPASLLQRKFPQLISPAGRVNGNADSKLEQGPALDSSWKGGFEILDRPFKDFNYEGFQAHPRSKVHCKVLEFSKKMPELLHFKLLPRKKVCTEIFQDDSPDEDDIGLYFSTTDESSSGYFFLLEFIEARDFVMRSEMKEVELLMFTSKILPAASQTWNEKHFLWGLFRRIKKQKDVYKLYEELPLVVQSFDCAATNDGDDCSDDMEIDMLAGNGVGRIDIPIPRESCRNIGSSSEGNIIPIPLQGSDMKMSAVSGKSNSTNLKNEIKKEMWLDIPPGFEETYRLKIQNSGFSWH